MKEIFVTFCKGAFATFFSLYTLFVIYGVYELGIVFMWPLIKIEAGFILVISLLVISHVLGKYEKRLLDFANGGPPILKK